MRRLRMKIDISGTVGDDAWRKLNHFSEVKGGEFGPACGSGGPCRHAADQPHAAGEWWGAVIDVGNNFVAEYALPHYLEQPRVIDAYIEDVP
jgi:hypothetical protein